MFWPISMPDAPLSSFRGPAWRLVEAQHRVSTLKLVDSLEEQDLLERLLEESKPALPPEARGLHYLLATPFRYRPYPVGSRFRRAGMTPGVFYAAERVETALAEMAFYRLLFFAESPQTPLPENAADYSAFSVKLKTDAAVNLTLPPFHAERQKWEHKTDYGACQALADAVRAQGAELIRYRSVRDPDAGLNLAVLGSKAFAEKAPSDWQGWKLYIGRKSVQALRDFPAATLEFSRAGFAADPRLGGLAGQ
jgi:hypothetical protein